MSESRVQEREKEVATWKREECGNREQKEKG